MVGRPRTRLRKISALCDQASAVFLAMNDLMRPETFDRSNDDPIAQAWRLAHDDAFFASISMADLRNKIAKRAGLPLPLSPVDSPTAALDGAAGLEDDAVAEFASHRVPA